MTITKAIPAAQWRGLDLHPGDSLHVVSVTDSEFLVEINRPETRPDSGPGKAREWLRSAKGSVRLAADVSVDDARSEYYATKYGLDR